MRIFKYIRRKLHLHFKRRKTIYIKKEIMTPIEKDFYNKIKDLETDYKIVPQLNLASIIYKMYNTKYYTDLFRNIDFAIFDKDYNKVLLLIELNDKSHNLKRKKARDLKVQNICQEVGIPLIKFYTHYPNEKQYVIDRIIKTINNANIDNNEDTNN